MTDDATIAYYEKSAPHYTLSFGHAPSRHLDGFLNRLEPGSAILELGCGTGRDAAHMQSRGFAVDATDGTQAMVAKANERFNLGARLMRFDQLDVEGAYDAVWAHACLLHVARTGIPSALAAIHRALRPGGWHYASYKLGGGEGRCPLGRLHNFPDPEWIEARYAEAGFAIVDTMIYRGQGADGTVRDWIAITARKLS